MPKAIRIAIAAAGVTLAGTLATAPVVSNLSERLASHARAGTNEESTMKHQMHPSAGRSVQASASASAHASSSSTAEGSGTHCASESSATLLVNGTRRVVRESHQVSEDGACSSSSKASLGMDSGDAARDGLGGSGAAPSAQTGRSGGEASD